MKRILFFDEKVLLCKFKKGKGFKRRIFNVKLRKFLWVIFKKPVINLKTDENW